MSQPEEKLAELLLELVDSGPVAEKYARHVPLRDVQLACEGMAALLAPHLLKVLKVEDLQSYVEDYHA